MKGTRTCWLLGVGWLLAAGLGLRAHDSPEHVVEMLTARMEAVGRRPDLLWRRATEYRVLGQLSQAAADLREAVRARPDFVQALLDLSRVQLAQQDPKRSLATLSRALKLELDPSMQASLRMAGAEVLAANGKLAEAVTECDRALANDAVQDPEWYLTRSQFQYRLGRHADAAGGLQRGFERIGNPVLEAEWIEAMIDAGRCDEAIRRIEPLLAESRWQASWRVRRGRAWLGLGETSRAHADLLGAITELNTRLRGDRPDLLLLAERGLAYALVGDEPLARADLARAQLAGADRWVTARLSQALEDREAR